MTSGRVHKTRYFIGTPSVLEVHLSDPLAGMCGLRWRPQTLSNVHYKESIYLAFTFRQLSKQVALDTRHYCESVIILLIKIYCVLDIWIP